MTNCPKLKGRIEKESIKKSGPEKSTVLELKKKRYSGKLRPRGRPRNYRTYPNPTPGEHVCEPDEGFEPKRQLEPKATDWSAFLEIDVWPPIQLQHK